MGLVHAFTSGKAVAADATVVDGPNWDADHNFTGGNLGALLYQGTAGLVTGINSVATGQVLTSAGAGSVPAWSASPSVTNLTATALVSAASAVATPAGGSTAAKLTIGSAALGIHIGSGVPTVSAPQGSLYLRSDGGAATRLYVNTDGATAWSVISTGLLLLATQTVAGAANYDFTDLSGYGEIVVVARGVTKSASGILNLLVSTDNGSTFLTASGDYLDVAAAGTVSNNTAMDFHATATTALRSGRITIWGFNTTGQKAAHTTASVLNYIIPTTTALNAIRVVPSGGGTLDAGTIYVYGR